MMETQPTTKNRSLGQEVGVGVEVGAVVVVVTSLHHRRRQGG
jgi:hypothetical protein